MDTTIYTRETFHIVKAKLDDLYALADQSPESMNEDSRVIRDIVELNLSMPTELSMNYKMQRDSRTANADVSTMWNVLRIDALVGISTCKIGIVRQRHASVYKDGEAARLARMMTHDFSLLDTASSKYPVESTQSAGIAGPTFSSDPIFQLVNLSLNGSIDAFPPPRGVEHALSPGNTFR